MGHKKPNTIIRASEAGQIPKYKFSGFTRRPVNYFRDIIIDEEADNIEGFNEQELQEKVQSAIVAEREKNRGHYEKLLDEKFRAGVKNGRDEAGTELKGAIDLLLQYARLLQQEKQEVVARHEKEVLDLAFQLAQKVLGRELDEHPESVADIARTAIQQLIDCDKIKLLVNPEDLSYLRSVQEELESQMSREAHLEIRSDPSVERGGCLLETDRGLLDARVSSQLETMKASLAQDSSSKPNS